ncbi:hypothetical protein BG015_006371, partial [Linnemannia schmuckeri]
AQGQEQEEEEEETIHTFKISKSGSMLICTLCDGRVALFEFGSSWKSAAETEVVVMPEDWYDARSLAVSEFGGVAVVGEEDVDQQQHTEHYQEP